MQTIPGVGVVTALTWAVEIVDPQRFPSIGRAVSYCGLVGGEQESAGKRYRGPLSKQRNGHLQAVLIEAAKLAPRRGTIRPWWRSTRRRRQPPTRPTKRR